MGTRYDLPLWHLAALEWFEANAGVDLPARPCDVGLSIKVTSDRRGIWKPADTPYALSVVQTWKGVYEDLDPIRSPDDESWTYYYHQQGAGTEALRTPESRYDNRALFQCMYDRVPIGVVIPSASGRGYEVLGLALVESYASGYFQLIGPASLAHATTARVAESLATVTTSLVELPLGPFDPHAHTDSRLKVVRAVHQRQGGNRFRRALLTAYEGRCAITQYDAPPALEAAHIVPYKGPQTNHVVNGLLLRADMHDLFDLGLIAVDTASMQLRLATELAGTMYEEYADSPLWLPKDDSLRPNLEALEIHREQSRVA